MKRLVILAIGAGSLAGVAAGCSSSSSSPPPSSSTSSPASPAPAGSGAAMVKTASSSLGQILVDGSGRTLYLYKTDTGTTPMCTGSCASLWPPDTTTGTPQASGVSASAVGTTVRPDTHATQVTFDGHPLYYYSGDAKAGDVTGQGTQGVWFAVSPSGGAIITTPAPSTSNSGGGGYGY